MRDGDRVLQVDVRGVVDESACGNVSASEGGRERAGERARERGRKEGRKGGREGKDGQFERAMR